MTKVLERRRALELRKQGKSYSQIKQALGLSKSTLSEWLRNYPLSKEQIDALRGKSPIRIERYRQTMFLKRQKRLEGYYKEEKNKWLPLSKRELFVAGLFLYWGEGNKGINSQTYISNTDPSVLKFVLFWMKEVLSIPKDRIRVYIHLYNDMNIGKELTYWSQELKLPLTQFCKPYIKVSKRAQLDQRGYGHGTCALVVNNARLKERIVMAIRAIGDAYSYRLREL